MAEKRRHNPGAGPPLPPGGFGPGGYGKKAPDATDPGQNPDREDRRLQRETAAQPKPPPEQEPEQPARELPEVPVPEVPPELPDDIPAPPDPNLPPANPVDSRSGRR